VSWWSFIGQSAIAGGCIAAAVMGQVEFGIPCVVGGAASYLPFGLSQSSASSGLQRLPCESARSAAGG